MSNSTKQDVYNRIFDGFQKMSKQDIVIAPWLATDDGQERLSKTLKLQLKQHARDLAASCRDSEVFWTDVHLTPEFRERAFYEVLLSTAANLSYLRLGTLIITEEMVSVSNSLLRDHLGNSGSTALLSVYARVITYLNNQLLLYYGEVTEETFVSGKWHRPWIDYSLGHELNSAIEYGFMEQIVRNGQRLIRLTAVGEELYRECRNDLEKCGYIMQREQLTRAANFTNMDDYEKILERIVSNIHERRKLLIEWSDIKPGIKVLELGCGTGSLTLEDGLYEVVGNNGNVIATDPSVGMLERAKVKLSSFGAKNVQFRQAPAESIPFHDNSFDAVVGMLFLHFTDIRKTLQEIHRVLKPGGTFTTVYVLNFSNEEDFFTEWFEPVFNMGLAARDSVILPTSEEVPSIAGRYFDHFEHETQEWMADSSEVEDVVKFLVEAGTMAELNELPLEARKTLFRELIDRGYSVKQKYGAAARKRSQAVQWFKGTVAK
ncbi:class I SAM-dependent methyltransferase [Alicyclobacillus sp. SO9]|uniref:class I SAM-dependent methyltransferase n=1 Tax=Alicyclobacillus sp. SO9 TaxID=2665646 RepID=UPI0018E84299|nr:methyltransferase domain-containing protein [Alicyclobacillus sp. SO9]QQE79541.1 methyltransferase domain-containing protein [Alicyclobacillus sp. SO9]